MSPIASTSSHFSSQSFYHSRGSEGRNNEVGSAGTVFGQDSRVDEEGSLAYLAPGILQPENEGDTITEDISFIPRESATTRQKPMDSCILPMPPTMEAAP
jgi:hypothetical protein